MIVEPDALANLPSDCSATTDPTGALTAGRIADIKYAVSALEAQPHTVVYLDAGQQPVALRRGHGAAADRRPASARPRASS